MLSTRDNTYVETFKHYKPRVATTEAKERVRPTPRITYKEPVETNLRLSVAQILPVVAKHCKADQEKILAAGQPGRRASKARVMLVGFFITGLKYKNSRAAAVTGLSPSVTCTNYVRHAELMLSNPEYKALYTAIDRELLNLSNSI